MKKTIFFFLLGGLILMTGNLHAQELSKENKKKYQNLAKQYKKNPASLKKLTDEHRKFKKENALLVNEINQLRSQAGNSDQQFDQLRNDLEMANQRLMEANARIDELSSQPAPAPKEDYMSGVVFRVQLGAYKDRQIAERLEPGENMAMEDSDDLQKIVVGQFRDYEKASRLKKNLIAMGLDDAWIVSYRDGMRISIDEALGN